MKERECVRERKRDRGKKKRERGQRLGRNRTIEILRERGTDDIEQISRRKEAEEWKEKERRKEGRKQL